LRRKSQDRFSVDSDDSKSTLSELNQDTTEEITISSLCSCFKKIKKLQPDYDEIGGFNPDNPVLSKVIPQYDDSNNKNEEVDSSRLD